MRALQNNYWISVGSIRLAAEIFTLQSVKIGNGTPLSANMFILIKQENFPGQTSDRKLRFNRKSVMSTEWLILLAKSVQKSGEINEQNDPRAKICQDKIKGHTMNRLSE